MFIPPCFRPTVTANDNLYTLTICTLHSTTAPTYSTRPQKGTVDATGPSKYTLTKLVRPPVSPAGWFSHRLVLRAYVAESEDQTCVILTAEA